MSAKPTPPMNRIWSIAACLCLYLAIASLYLERDGNHFRLNRNSRAYQLGDHSNEVVFLGASLIGDSIVPGVVEDELGASAFALSFPRCQVWTYYFVWRDLIRQRGKPRMLILGLTPTHLNADTTDYEAAKFGSVRDILTMMRMENFWPRRKLFRDRLRQVLQGWPRLLFGIEPPVLDDTRKMKGSHYWYRLAEPERANAQVGDFSHLPDEAMYQRVLQRERREARRDFSLGDSRYWLEKLLVEAKAEDVKVAFLLFRFSERMASDLGEHHVAEAEALLDEIAGENQVPIWRAWEIWPGIADWQVHYDGARHLKPEPAHDFSKALSAGPLREYLVGQ